MSIYVLFIVTIFIFMMLGKISNKYYRINIRNKVLDGEGIMKAPSLASKSNPSKFDYFTIAALIVIFAFSAFRYDVGWDYDAYYNTIKFGITTNMMNNNEFATILLLDFARKIGITNFYFFINTFICIYFVSITIRRYSKDNWLSIIFFVCFPLFYLNSLSVVRLFTALALTFYGFRYIEEQKIGKYIFIVILASMFHMTALISLIFYFAKNIKLRTKSIIIIGVSLPFMNTILNTVAIKYLPQYAVYTQDTLIQEGTKAIIVFVLIGIAVLMFRKQMTYNDTTAELYSNIFFLGLSIYLMFFSQGTMGHRLSLYGTIYSVLIVPKLISIFDYRSKILLEFMVYLALIMMFLYTVKVGEATYIPYKTIFNIG